MPAAHYQGLGHRVGAALVLLGVYYASGLLGLELASLHSSVSPVWPPTGIAIAGLILLGLRAWPIILAGAFLFNATTGGQVGPSAVIAVGNTLEAMAGAWLVRKYAGGPEALQTVPNAMRFAIVALLAPTLSAGIGVATLVLSGSAPANQTEAIALTWWLGDVAGALVLTPLVLAWARRGQPTREAEGLLLVAAAVGAGALAIRAGPHDMGLAAAAGLALLLVITWTALRFGPRMLTLTVAGWTGLATWATVHGHGPFVRGSENEGLLLLQLFVSGLAASVLVMAGASCERRSTGHEPSRRLVAVSLGILPLLLGLPLVSALAEPDVQTRDDHADDDLDALTASWETVLRRHEAHLQDARAFFDSSSDVNRTEYTTYAQASRWLESPEIQATTFNRLLRPDQLAAFEANTQADASLPAEVRSSYGIHPRIDAPLHPVIDYVVPLAGNEAALGVDLAGNATRMQALQQAIDTGEPVGTGPIELVQEQGAPGFVVYLAVYRGGDPGDLASRRDQAVGVVAAAYRVRELSAVVQSHLSGHVAAVAITDAGPWGAETSQPHVVIPANTSDADHTLLLQVFGREWLLTVQLDAARPTTAIGAAPWFVLLTGGALSITFTLAAYAFESTTRRAQSLAHGMTALVQDEKAKLEEAQHIAHVGSWEWDVGTGRLFWSPELYRLFGVTPDDFNPDYAAYLQRVHPDDRPALEAVIKTALADQQPYDIEHRFLRPTGEVRWMRSRGHAEVEDGKPVRLAGTAQDITETHLAEERFRGIVEAAPDAMIIVDEAGRILLANLEAERLFGYSRAELLNLGVEALVPAASRARHAGLRQNYVQHAQKRPMGRGLELAALRKDGTEVPVEISLSPIRSAEGARVAATIRDVTDRRRAEKERAAAEANAQQLRRLQEVNRFKTQFINTAAHELRTPLMPMRTEVFLLKSSKTDPASPTQLRKLEIVERNLERLSTLVEDLLTVARQQAGRLAIEPRPMDLIELAAETTETFRALAKERNLTLTLDGPPTLPVVADAKRISQVILNLLSNAVKFTPSGGSVSLRLSASNALVRCEVIDTGIGILPERHLELFQPFAQVHDAMQMTHPGSGLGLYICREFVEMHGGAIGVISSGRGKGSTFWFELPVAGPPTPASTTPPDPSKSQGDPPT